MNCEIIGVVNDPSHIVGFVSQTVVVIGVVNNPQAIVGFVPACICEGE